MQRLQLQRRGNTPHLPGDDIENMYLQDWLFAAARALCVSVPLNDFVKASISDHVREFSEEAVWKLGRSMEIRTAYAVEARDLEVAKVGGLCVWSRKNSNSDFGLKRKALLPSSGEMGRGADLLKDFSVPFDYRRFRKSRRALTIGQIRDKVRFSRAGGEPRQVRQLVLKHPGTAVELPSEFGQCEEAVQMIIDHNAAIILTMRLLTLI